MFMQQWNLSLHNVDGRTQQLSKLEPAYPLQIHQLNHNFAGITHQKVE